MFTVKSRVFHVMTRTSETVPVLTQYDLCQTRDNRQNTCIHVNTYENTFLLERYNWFRNGSLFAGTGTDTGYLT